MITLEQAFAEVPVVAIIRGVKPDEAVGIAEALYEGGLRIVEVPLNSPDPFVSIRRIVDRFGDKMVVGSGTVLTAENVDRTAQAGGRIVVSPDTQAEVIGRSVELGLTPMPGFGTATEAFRAYAAGARWIKLFPASTYGSGHVKALKAVLPKDTLVLAVGGVGPDVMEDWFTAGVAGFGLGSEVYRVGQGPEDTLAKAKTVVAAARRR